MIICEEPLEASSVTVEILDFLVPVMPGYFTGMLLEEKLETLKRNCKWTKQKLLKLVLSDSMGCCYFAMVVLLP